jgi:hypothetical protein
MPDMFTRRRLLQAAALAAPRAEGPGPDLDRVDLVDAARGRRSDPHPHAGGAEAPGLLSSSSQSGLAGRSPPLAMPGGPGRRRGSWACTTTPNFVQVPDPTLPAEDARAVRAALAAAMGQGASGVSLTEVMERPVFLPKPPG